MAFRLSSKGKKITEILLLTAVVVAAFFYWDSFVTYPVKLLVVLLHESSHGLMTLITGGRIIEMQITYQLGGACIAKGGNSLFIAPAGYIGSALLGALIFASTKNFRFSLGVCNVLAIIFLLLVVLYIKTIFGILFTLGFCVLFFLSPRFLPKFLHFFLLRVIGIISCLYVIIDIKEDLLTSGAHRTDASILASLTHIPAIGWGIIMFLISVTVTLILIRDYLKRG
ncbi:MAG TPA: M50 family metallopeptidase [Ignavibacteriales bacterium]|nr:M50 family metallopeptidase [Ignavibacteriales bacterium]